MKTKEQKGMEAATRQGIYDSLTPKQRLAKLDKYGFAAKKERAKIAELIAQQASRKGAK